MAEWHDFGKSQSVISWAPFLAVLATVLKAGTEIILTTGAKVCKGSTIIVCQFSDEDLLNYAINQVMK
jgi:uncharacterized membrane protein YhaH (DUF805 family)